MDAVTQLALQQLYDTAADEPSAEVSISVSAVELYNEVLRCLLSGRENMQLRCTTGAGGVAGVVLEGVDERLCSSVAEAMELVRLAKSSRAVGETRANARSSRSHLIVRVKVEVLQLSGPADSSGTKGPQQQLAPKAPGPPPATVTFSTLNLVDLAGSERVDKTGSSDTPLRLREALNINKSLLCLGNVVNALAERSEGRRGATGHVPYRDSKLTRLLEDSLGGNAHTALIACITQLPEWHLEQSRNTLEFAARAARVVCKPRRNVLSLPPPAEAPATSAPDAQALIAALQAEVAGLKAQLAAQQGQAGQARHQPLAQQPQPPKQLPQQEGPAFAPLQPAALVTQPWGRCSPVSSAGGAASCSPEPAAGELGAAGAGSAPFAVQTLPSPRGALSSSSSSQLQGAHTTSLLSRGSGQGSLLWRLLQQQQQQQLLLPGAGPHGGSLAGLASRHSQPRSRAAAQSLTSTGLLITSSGNAATAAAAVAANAVGMLTRWATFSGGAPGAWLASQRSQRSQRSLSMGLPRRSELDGALISGTAPPVAQPGAERSSLAWRASCTLPLQRRITTDGSLCGGGSANGGGSGGDGTHTIGPGLLESQAAAAEAAMALRDHIIKQLVQALQQKKAELKALKEQLASVLRQLDSADEEGEASKAKLRELAEGIQMLAATRQEEFEKWKGHLVGLETALQAAQQEATSYRSESQSLVQQLAQLQARYASLQTDSAQQRNSLLTTFSLAQGRSQLQGDQFATCLNTLAAIEGALQRLLARQSVGAGPLSRGVLQSGSEGAQKRKLPQRPPPQQGQQELGGGSSGAPTPRGATTGGGAGDKHRTDVSSHCIQTVSTRVFDMNSGLISTAVDAEGEQGSLTAAAADATAAARLAQLEYVLVELAGLMPLVRAAAAAATAANAATAAANAAAAAASPRGSAAASLHTLEEQLHSIGTGSAKAVPSLGPGQAQSEAGARPAARCHKCDSLKPILVIMQKLKDEVVLLKAGIRARDTQLAAAEDASGAMQHNLGEARQQVAALQERIAELCEDLAAARSAAARATTTTAAAAATMSAPCSDRGSDKAEMLDSLQLAPRGSLELEEPRLLLLCPRRSALSGDASSVTDMPSPRRGLLSRDAASASAVRGVPLMAVDAPLQELHAQILHSWHALAMPAAFRCAFVLGGSGAAAAASAAGGDAAAAGPAVRPAAAPWNDRAQCQAHVALLACLHQYHEDEPAVTVLQRSVLGDECAVLEAGLAALQAEEFERLAQQWGVQEGEPAAQRAALLAKLWVPCAAAAADALAAASAAACQQALMAAPAAQLAGIALRSNASLLAMTSNALAEAAS